MFLMRFRRRPAASASFISEIFHPLLMRSVRTCKGEEGSGRPGNVMSAVVRVLARVGAKY